MVHTHGGYQVYTYTTLKSVFDIKDEDRWWCAADPGWITGHSYIVYGPLILGSTSFMYEGAPTHPYPNRWWQLIEKYAVTVLYTAPTAIRAFMKWGMDPPVDMTGNPLLYLAGLGIVVGVQFLLMGVLAEMQMRTYHEAQGKRPYHVREWVVGGRY